jgi:cell division protein FtsB
MIIGVKTQQAQIEELREQNQSLKIRIEALEDR